MSGTSLDGVDVAFCKFINSGSNWDFEIGEAKTYPYSKDIKQKLINAHTLPAIALMQLDAQLASLFSQCVLDFIRQFNLKPDFISSHGHTVFHQPLTGNHAESSQIPSGNLETEKHEIENPKPFTTQIASGAIIAALTGIDVICDFRSADVALSGQGAPLVPIGDKMLFSNYDCCLNLGGIANISFDKYTPIQKQEDVTGDRIASDICFANMGLNYLASLANLDYDKDGLLAAKGLVDEHLLNALNDLEFHQQPFPKSIGKEYFENSLQPLLNNSTLSIETKLRTFCQYILVQIQNNLPTETQKLLVTGGGAHNKFLMNLLLQNLPVKVVLPDTKTIDFKEALIFAFLGVLRFRGEINVFSSVTGAKRNSIAGAIYKGKND